MGVCENKKLKSVSLTDAIEYIVGGLTVMLIWLSSAIVCAQDYFPINGVKDKREELYAFVNATLHVDYKRTLSHATLLIKEGKILAAGQSVQVPRNAVVIELNGAHIYPSFIELISDYGLPEVKKATKETLYPQYESNMKGAYGWNQAIRADQEAFRDFSPNEEKAKLLREGGFGAVVTHYRDGIARGSGSLVLTGSENAQKMLLINSVAAFYSFDKGSSTQLYPSSLMGAIALLRQTYLDAQWYARMEGKTEKNISLEKWNSLQSLPQLFETNQVLNVLRAAAISREFGVNYIIRGGGDEYQRAEEIKAAGIRLIVPLRFPKAYDVEDPFDAHHVSLAEMKHWELAPANAYLLYQQRIPFAFTSEGLDKPAEVLTMLQKVVEYGLPKEEALKAFTYTPALFINHLDLLGTLDAGKLANFFITTGDLFDKKTKIVQHWVRGKQYELHEWDFHDIRGHYELTFSDKKYRVTIEGELLEPAMKININDTQKVELSLTRKGKLVTMYFAMQKDSSSQFARLSGISDGRQWKGKLQLPDGVWYDWQLIYTAPLEKKEEKKEMQQPEYGKIIYPFVAYGYSEKPTQQTVLFKNATVWTNEKEGILTHTDVLIENGKIKAVGKNLSAPTAAIIVDATGKHLTSGIIDEHSHIAISRGVNEGTQSSSAEVRIGDVINSEDINIYRQLAGGVTAAQLLHGSANPIGGQSALIKMRWGFSPEKMKIEGADAFIKFALGENVKQSNWGDFQTIRFPQTRMGVEQVYVDFFTRALAYEKEWNNYLALSSKQKKFTPPPRRDLELEAILEILRGKRFITCHSYVQSEINMLMHLADSFGFKVNTFTHVLEGYKVADKMQQHGAHASTFSDWWAYKYEVIDAIPHNAAILHRAGVNTAINSDDVEMGRRLNQEAAKSVKYAGISEEEAWKMITLNPARMLHLEHRTGSIAPGKDADIVLWSENPLSVYAKVEKTFVDGYCFFDATTDKILRRQIADERNRLIQKMLDAKRSGAPTQKPVKKEQKLYHCEDLESDY